MKKDRTEFYMLATYLAVIILSFAIASIIVKP